MKNRDSYLNQLINLKDKPIIKIVTGIRRVGKSTLLQLFYNYLLKNGVLPEQIIRINFESLEFDDIKTYKELYNYVKERISLNKTYLLLDEIQMVTSFEKAINSFMVDFNIDIYITGSNGYLLSSELSTLLSGRYVEIKMLPLSFKEYLYFNNYSKEGDINHYFNEYIEYGGLPSITEMKTHPETITQFLEGVFNTILIKDVALRNEIRDISLLESVIRFVVSNIGNFISTKKIADYLTSNGRKVNSETIDNYLKMLENAFIIYRVKRYDIKGKLYLKTLEKFYVVDTGLKNQIIGFRNDDYGFTLENIIYFELLRRGFYVSIGKVGTLEVDFIATNKSKKIYYQVSATIQNDETKKRELLPFENIDDNYEKVILTMDKTFIKDYNGIKNINIIDFLLEE